jgi:hypothetical protein
MKLSTVGNEKNNEKVNYKYPGNLVGIDHTDYGCCKGRRLKITLP